jgi:hypothetical protein
MQYVEILGPIAASAVIGYLVALGALEARLRFLNRGSRSAEAIQRLLGFRPGTNLRSLMFVIFGKLPTDPQARALMLAAEISLMSFFGIGMALLGMAMGFALGSR